jgi:hypothetical protein
MHRDEIKKKTIQLKNKRMRTKFDIKNRWNQMLMDEINK